MNATRTVARVGRSILVATKAIRVIFPIGVGAETGFTPWSGSLNIVDEACCDLTHGVGLMLPGGFLG